MLQYSFTTIAAWALALLASCMVLTRSYTEIRYAASMRIRNGSQRSSHVPIIPYSILWLGHTIAFFTKPQACLRPLGRHMRHGIFGVVLGGRKCHVIMSLSLAKQVLAVQSPINNHDMVGHFMRNVWDDKGAIGRMDQAVLWGKIHRAVYKLNREPFLSRAGDMVTHNIEKSVLNLVSARSSDFNWQKGADVAVHGRNDFEVSFFPLVRHFVADMVLPSLYGTAFMKNYPDIATDLFQFDANFHWFLMGFPVWAPISGMKESAAARARVKIALADFHNAVVARSRGGPTDNRWGNMDDVSNVMQDRVLLWEEAVGESSNKEDMCSSSHAFLLWVTLINANVAIFWLVFHIYEDSALLAAIREEVSPFVNAQESQSMVKLDSPGIWSRTPLLQSSFLEVMRLYTQSNSFKNVQGDFTVTESEVDHNIRDSSTFTTKCEQGNSARSYRLERGDLVCVPFGLYQSDPSVWDQPETFNGRRFLVPGQGAEGKVSVNFTGINPWGSGASLCKAQKFSHREVIEVAAAIVACWDIEPAHAQEWTHPGLARAGGTTVSKEDLRVKLRRRLP